MLTHIHVQLMYMYSLTLTHTHTHGVPTGNDGEKKEVVRERDEPVMTKFSEHTAFIHCHGCPLFLPPVNVQTTKLV